MPNLNPTLSSKQAVLIVTILAMSFLSYCTYGVYRTWHPGPVSTDIAEYPEMRTRFKEIYPWAPDFLPDSIPPSATNIFYSAFPYSVMQGRPTLDLAFMLSPEDAQIELERLRTLDASMESLTSTTAEDGMIYFHYTSTFGTTANVAFDPASNSFSYSLSSD